jgi:hypothetical protein
MIDAYEFPTEMPDDVAPGALRWTATIIGLTTALLALFNAQAITGWVEDLTPGPSTVKLVAAANSWEEATASAGLGKGHARLHKAWTRVERTRWSGEDEVQLAQR